MNTTIGNQEVITERPLNGGDRIHLRGCRNEFEITSFDGTIATARRVHSKTGELEGGQPFRFDPTNTVYLKLGSLNNYI